jgi:hypothetical protein
MSIRGGTIRWLDAALDRGDALTAWTTAHELPKGHLSLDYALAIVTLVSAGDPDRAERAAARWLRRARAELPGVDGEELSEILAELPDLMAVTRLAGECERYGWPRTLATLDHLLPRA